MVCTLTRSHWLAATPLGFGLLTEHNNLVFIFDPLSQVSDLLEARVPKVLRWAVRLSIYSFICYDISGTDNV